MKLSNLIFGLLFIFLLSCMANQDDIVEPSQKVVDTVRVLSRDKEIDEKFSEFELDSIFKYLQTTPIVEFPKEWLKLTKYGYEYKLEIPAEKENERLVIYENSNTYVLSFQDGHSAITYLIVDFIKQNENISITYLSSTTWDSGNLFSIYETERKHRFEKFKIFNYDEAYGLFDCDFPIMNSRFVDKSNQFQYETIELPSQYDEYEFREEVPAQPVQVEEAACEGGE